MNLKLNSLLAGGLMTIALSLSAIAAQADESRYMTQLPSYVMEDLDLSPSQEREMQRIRQNARSRLMQVFTPDELRELNTLMSDEGQTFREALIELNLPDDRLAEVQEVVRSSRREAFEALTPEQQEELMDYIMSQQDDNNLF